MKRILCVSLALVILLSACGGNTPARTADESLTWQEQYDLGLRYLSEGNYEEAILAFAAAIEIDPKRPEAYIGLADAYYAQGDETAARAALEHGLTKVENRAILEEHIDRLWPDALSGEPDAEEPEGTETQQEKEPEVTGGAVTTPGKVEYGVISISDFSYYYEKGGYVAQANEGAVGGVTLHFVVNAPENARDALIWTFSSDGVDRETVGSEIDYAVSIWKDEGVPGRDSEAPPFTCDQGFPIYENDLGKQMEVLLVGIDENGDPVGYAIVSVQVPG